MGTSAPRLTDERIDKAVRLLDAWTGKLTWDRYLAVLETEIGHRYSKVAMHKQPRIIAAWEFAHRRLQEAVNSVGARGHGDAAIAELHRKIKELKSTNERLEQENRDLLERFRMWAFNAAQKGCAEADLNRPLPVPRKG